MNEKIVTPSLRDISQVKGIVGRTLTFPPLIKYSKKIFGFSDNIFPSETLLCPLPYRTQTRDVL